jgi:endonuclease/exonuclease/phosphatase (EEP) superfamily protein YafD
VLHLRRPGRPTLRRDRDTWWTYAIAAVGVLGVAAAVLALIARTVDWAWKPAIIAAAFAHQVLWASPVALVLLAAVRRWYATGVAAVVLVLAVATQLPLYVGADVPAGGTRLTVLQANLKVGAADPGALVSRVRAEHVDVLTTEEITPAERGRLVSAGLGRSLPYRYEAILPSGGNTIWSRYPLSNGENHPGYVLGVASAVLHLPGGRPVRIVCVHLLPPYPYPSYHWAEEIRRLRTELQGGQGPVIVGGDFNSTTDNARFRDLLAHGYADATEHAGAGYLATYPSDRFTGPLIAIDHVLTRDADAVDARTVTLPRSDHRGLLVHLRLRPTVGS